MILSKRPLEGLIGEGGGGGGGEGGGGVSEIYRLSLSEISGVTTEMKLKGTEMSFYKFNTFKIALWGDWRYDFGLRQISKNARRGNTNRNFNKIIVIGLTLQVLSQKQNGNTYIHT